MLLVQIPASLNQGNCTFYLGKAGPGRDCLGVLMVSVWKRTAVYFLASPTAVENAYILRKLDVDTLVCWGEKFVAWNIAEWCTPPGCVVLIALLGKMISPA